MPVSKSRARPRRTQRKGFWPDVCAPGAQSRRHAARAVAFSFAGPAGGAALGSVEDAAPSPLQRAAGVIKSRLSTRSARGTNPRGAALRGAGLVRSVGGSFLCLACVPRAPRPDASASVRRLPSAFLVRGAAVGTAVSHSLRFEFVSSRPNAVRFRPVQGEGVDGGYVPGNGIQRFSFLSLRAPKRGGAPRVPPFRPCNTATLGGVPQISPSLRRVPPRHVEAACRLLNFGHVTRFPGKSLKPPWPELCHYPRGGRSPA